LLRKRGIQTGKGKDQGIGNKGTHKQSVGLLRMEERMSRFSTCNPETWGGKKVKEEMYDAHSSTGVSLNWQGRDPESTQYIM
jgi:hypothetical protein